MADPDALRYLRIARSDLTCFAVQSRTDDSIEIAQPDWPALMTATSAFLDEVEHQAQ
ncbi:hypothetical protein [Synechococcus sp. CS-1328]|uniref:hypothetical protein n=1 Tax=Synechococcus sp. CS-1328 TaxID=2847976 RepID=UPI00223AD27F|nr:hypothetical protein [Synechococcus sp. CS-1328]